MELLYLSFIVILASIVGTVSGFGISTLMIPVVIMFYPPGEALLFVGIIHLFGDLWKLLLFAKAIRWRLILSFALPGLVLSFIGARLIATVPEGLPQRIIGAFLLAYTVYLFTKPNFKIPANQYTAAAGGASSGLLAGLFGMGGAIRTLFLSAFNLPKEVYIAASGGIALLIDITRLVTYTASGTRLDEKLLWGMLIFIPLSLGGARLAKTVVDKIPQKYFRPVIAAFLLLAGLKLVLLP